MDINRRALLTALTAAPVTAALATGSAQARSRASGAALPSVVMEKVLLAAQLDPVKTGTGVTTGAGPSVRLVEQALVAGGFLEASYVDGHFGSATRSAYVKYQESLGYTGLAANGLPGKASLTRLGEGTFTVARPVSIEARTTFQDYPFNARTVAMLTEAQRLSGVKGVVEQGSYSPGADPTSAGTHDGGGAVDLDAEQLTAAQRTTLVTAMRRVGFAAWLRTPDQADWPLHVHGVAVNDTDLHVTAQQQVGKYYLGRNGLRSDLPDDGPQVTKVTWEDYQRQHA